jgi:hypothetical protein
VRSRRVATGPLARRYRIGKTSARVGRSALRGRQGEPEFLVFGATFSRRLTAHETVEPVRSHGLEGQASAGMSRFLDSQIRIKGQERTLFDPTASCAPGGGSALTVTSRSDGEAIRASTEHRRERRRGRSAVGSRKLRAYPGGGRSGGSNGRHRQRGRRRRRIDRDVNE